MGLVWDGMLDDAGDAVADAARSAAVEPEDELVEIGREKLGADGNVVGPEPATAWRG